MRKQFLSALAALLLGSQILLAIPARPGRIVHTQPDGSKIVLILHGDEFGHWTTDASGRLLRQDADGFYRVDTQNDLATVQRRAAENRMNARRVRAARGQEHVAIGQKHFLVVLVEFKDLSFKVSKPQEAFTALLNEPGYSLNGGTGSARDFYYENSHGIFEPVFDVYGPVKISQNYSYYGRNSGENDVRPEDALIEGCRGLDKEIDFSRYDNDGDGKVDMVFMYYAGHNEAEGGPSDSIWPHQWDLSQAGKAETLDGVTVDKYACTSELRGASGTTMCGIATACHEFGHAMGLPDMYDTDYNTNGYAGGLYSYSTMCAGSYNNDGCTPPYFNFEERIFLGWVSESDYRTFDKAGTYTIGPASENVAYRTFTDMDGEYFVYENRPKTGWDSYIPAGGMLVYHADKSSRMVRISGWGGWSVSAHDLWYNWEQTNCINENGSHPCFYLIPASNQSALNTYHESGIPFPRSNVTSYTPVSWNGVTGEIAFSDITFSDGVLTLKADVPRVDLDYPSISDAGSYAAGERFSFVLDIPDDIAVPASVAWFYDDEPAGADSVTLTAGAHTVEAHLTYADGSTAVVSLEIDVK